MSDEYGDETYCLVRRRIWRTKLMGLPNARLDGSLEGLFQIVVEPAILLFRHQLIPDYPDQEPFFSPGLDPGDGPIELFLLLDAIGIEEGERDGDFLIRWEAIFGVKPGPDFVHIIQHCGTGAPAALRRHQGRADQRGPDKSPPLTQCSHAGWRFPISSLHCSKYNRLDKNVNQDNRPYR